MKEPQSAPADGSVVLPGHLIRVMGLCWLQRRLLLRSAGIGLVVAAIIAFTIPKRYESTVQLMPPDSQSMSGTALLAAMGGVAVPSGAAGLASSLLGGKSVGATFIAVVQSRTAQDDLINRFDLRRVYHKKRNVDARKKLENRTAIAENRKSGVISITVTDNDPYRARDLAAAYVEELNKLVNQLSTSSARRERIFLEDRLRAVKQDLDEASRLLSQFSSRNATLDVQNQGKATMEAAAKLQGELIVAESELRGLEATYTENNIRVRSGRARIAELQRQLQKMDGTGDDVNGADLKAGQLYPSLRQLPLLGVTYYDLYRRAKIQESIYEILTKEYELAKVQEAKEIPTVKVLDEPVLPEKKSFPPRLIIMLLGTALAFSAGVAWVIGNAAWEAKDQDDPAKDLARTVWSTLRQRDAGLSESFGGRIWRRTGSGGGNGDAPE